VSALHSRCGASGAGVGLSTRGVVAIVTRGATKYPDDLAAHAHASLQQFRQAHKLTQKRMAQVLGIGQDSMSRLEQRSDLLISTLRGYVEALGGRLSLVAEFPNQEPVILSGIAALDGDSAADA
jgi:hypothetical protein